MKVLEQFDKSISETLAHNVKSKGNVKGHLHNYRPVSYTHLTLPTILLV